MGLMAFVVGLMQWSFLPQPRRGLRLLRSVCRPDPVQLKNFIDVNTSKQGFLLQKMKYTSLLLRNERHIPVATGIGQQLRDMMNVVSFDDITPDPDRSSVPSPAH